MPKHLQIALLLLLASCVFSCQHTQAETSAVQEASWEALLQKKDLTDQPFSLFLRVFKHEDVIEAWVKSDTAKVYQLLKSFPVCRKSGDLGPKRQQGDLQVPEGVYYVDRFNPNSSYHLSLGLNYPNASDKKRGHPTTPGGDIFIHGDCVSVGCLPITNPLIEELYSLAEKAKTYEHPIAVHIFPFRMDAEHAASLSQGSTHLAFWKELRPIYQFFEDNQVLPIISVSPQGEYEVE